MSAHRENITGMSTWGCGTPPESAGAIARQRVPSRAKAVKDYAREVLRRASSRSVKCVEEDLRLYPEDRGEEVTMDAERQASIGSGKEQLLVTSKTKALDENNKVCKLDV